MPRSPPSSHLLVGEPASRAGERQREHRECEASGLHRIHPVRPGPANCREALFYNLVNLGEGGAKPVEGLERAIDWLQQNWGTTNVQWGQINRLQRHHWSGLETFGEDRTS